MSSEAEGKNIYIVASYCGTLAGRLIYYRARLKFWNRYPGDGYSHVSLSLDDTLDDMLSFARLKPENPLVAGLVRENIRTGVFAFHPEQTKIAVFAIPVSTEQYNSVKSSMEAAWKNRKEFRYNYLGLFTMLLTARGVARKNHYFCSQWVTEVLNHNDIRILGNRRPCQARPFDLYIALKDQMIFEGYLTSYPLYHSNKKRRRNPAGTGHASAFHPL